MIYIKNFNSVLKNIIFFLIRYSGFPFLIRNILQRKKTTIIFYHDIEKKLFEKHIIKLRRLYNIISLQDFIKYLYSNDKITLPQKSLIITFDDGHKNNYKLIEIIKKYKIPVTIFICSHIVGTNRGFWFKHFGYKRYKWLRTVQDDKRIEYLKGNNFNFEDEFEKREALSDSEINEMKEFVDFQSHSSFHSILPNCSYEKAKKELKESKEYLENKYFIKVNSFAYPNADYSLRDIQLLKNECYLTGHTAKCGFNDNKTDPYQLRRFCISDFSNINELLVQVSGLWCIIRNLLGKNTSGIKNNIADD